VRPGKNDPPLARAEARATIARAINKLYDQTARRPDGPDGKRSLAMSTLPDLLKAGGCLVLPGVYDGISAKVAASVGFDALYMTGYGTVASALGLPDAGLATFTEMLDRVRCIAGATPLPFIADGDSGYGGLLNVDRTVRGYAAAGAAGIQIEDQEFPKKCGHTEFRRVIPVADAVAKIRVAVDARPSREFLIVARTDARYAEGLDSALRRAEDFLAAGADVLFVESPESPEELRRIAETFRGAVLLANMVEGGRTPYVSRDELAALGFKIALFPVTAFLAAAGAMKVCYQHLKQHGTGTGSNVPALPFAEMNALMGFPAVHAFEKRYGVADGRSR
jgi:2,3-dimethylmalate lyase